MDNTDNNINNKNETLIDDESTKLENKNDNLNNYDTFECKNEEERNLVGSDKYSSTFLYFKMMNKRHSKFHIQATCLYILSLIVLEFLILQNGIMFRPLLLNNKIEIITYLALTFFGVATGWLIKNIFMEEFNPRRSILFAGLLALIFNLYIIITKSAYILFLFYPLISITIGIIHFSTTQLFEEFYMNDATKKDQHFNVRANKNLFISLSLLSSLLVTFCLWTVSQNFFANWNLGLLYFEAFILIIFILAFFTKDSPLSLYKNNSKDFTSIFELLEEIQQKKLEVLEKDQIVGEIKVILDNMSTNSFVLLFRHDLKKESVLVLLTILCHAYVNAAILMSVPNFTISTIPLTELDRMSYYFFRMFIMILIMSPGKVFGSLMIKYVTFIDRKYLICILFFFLTLFSILLTAISELTYLFAGLVLLFGFALNVVLINYAYEFYEPYLNDKAIKAYHFAYYVFAGLTMIFFETLFIINVTIAFSSIVVFSVAGFILAFFLTK